MKLFQKLKKIEEDIASLRFQNRREELANGIIHGIGAGLSIAALVLLVVFGSIYGNAWHITSFSIFGATLIFLYFSSTFFHFSKNEKLKNLFRMLDYVGIFLLIAGTYTPITLIYLRGSWGWSLFGTVWFLALSGIILRIFFPSRIELVLSVLYVLTGWVVLLASRPVLELVPAGLLGWLLIGGASYMAGLIFLSWKKLPYHHAIWHLFVLGGSISHFFGMLLHIQA